MGRAYTEEDWQNMTVADRWNTDYDRMAYGWASEQEPQPAQAAEEDRKRRLALLLQEQNRMQQNQLPQHHGIAFEGMNEKPLEGVTDWIGDGVADLADKLGLPQESLIVLGLVTKNGKVTKRGFQALINRAKPFNNKAKSFNGNKKTTNTSGGSKLNNKTDEFVGPPNQTYKSIMESGAASAGAKNNILKKLMSNMTNNKGRWGTGALIGGSVANNQFSSVDDGQSKEPLISFVDKEVKKQPNVITPVHDVNYRNKLAKQYYLIHSTQGEEAANEFIGAHINDNPAAIKAVTDKNATFVSAKNNELDKLMKEAEDMENRLGEGTIVDNPYKKPELEPAPDNRSDWEKFKDKHSYWFDKSKGGYSAGTNRAQEVGQLMTEMFSPSHWGIRGNVAKLRNAASIAEGKAATAATTARNKQREAQFKRLWDEASKNPKNFALMIRGYLPDDSPWWQLWGEMSEENKESYAMALAIKANEIQQDYLTKKGELANMESLMAAAIKRTPKPTA